jgi:hypothetical protein
MPADCATSVSPLSRCGTLSLSAGSRYTAKRVRTAGVQGTMMRRLMILPWLAVLAACAGGPPPEQGPMPGLRASFPPGAVIDVIRVDVLDPLPLRTAELVAPDGATAPSSSLNVEANPRSIGGQNSLHDPWRTSMLTANGINPLPSGGTDASLRSETVVLMTVSTAEIPLPDSVAYRQDWAHYRVRLGFAAPGNQLDIREIAAPAPPPAK